MIALITLGSIGIYKIYNQLSITKKVEIETLFILNTIEKLDSIYNVQSNFEGINENVLNNIGVNFNKKGGLELVPEHNYSISNDKNTFNFNYLNIYPQGCINLIIKLGFLLNRKI